MKLKVVNSQIYTCTINLKVADLILIISDSNISRVRTKIEIRSFIKAPTVIRYTQTTFHNSSLLVNLQSYGSEHIKVQNLYINILECIFISTPLSIYSDISSMFISNSTFKHSYRKGDGGAICIKTLHATSKVLIFQSTFEENAAEKGGMLHNIFGSGGALFVGAKKGGKIDLSIKDCIFKNNFAVGNGASLYLALGVRLSIFKSILLYETIDKANLKTIVYSVGRLIKYFELDIVIQNTELESGVRNYGILELNAVENIKMSVQCPDWYFHVVDTVEIVQDVILFLFTYKRIEKIRYQCRPCPDIFYTPSGNTAKYLYPSDQNNLSINTRSTPCIKCPYGASCPGNNVIPRQNYWGYWHEGELSFQACPAGYCCSGNDEAPCDHFDSCAGNRAGVLCGACREDFSVSILMGKCTPNVECGDDRWFSLLAVFGTMIYTLWYTFKDYILGCIFVAVNILRRPFIKKVKSQVIQKDKLSKDSGKEPVARDLKDIQTQAIPKKIQMKDIKSSVCMNDNKVDKGYFGIITFFVQMSAAMEIHVEFSEIDNSSSFLDMITENIGKLFSIQFSQLSIDACPFKGLTTVGKNAFRFTFLLGIYLSWMIIFFSGNFITHFLVNRKINIRTNNAKKSFRLSMVGGLIEIMKYTYSGFCEIIFMSLVCIRLGSDYVWWYDATNVCLENWQYVMVILGLIYAGPFPLTLASSMQMLKAQHITAWQFIACCFCQPFALYHTIKYRSYIKTKAISLKHPLTEESKAIISVLQGPYREGDNSTTLYWEALVSLRRLLITAMTLVGTASIRMIFITAFCIIFIIQHVHHAPFKVKQSNRVELLSLFLLSLVAVINLLKASLIDSGVVPFGPSVSFFKSLEVTEDTLLIILTAFIVFVEIGEKKMKSRPL